MSMHIAATDAEIEACTLPAVRSQGYGAKLLRELHRHARELGCQELHLDSGLQRLDAQRFYVREGMTITSYHFKTSLDPT